MAGESSLLAEATAPRQPDLDQQVGCEDCGQIKITKTTS